MEVYAAQIDRMDQGIGRILAALEETGQLDNTLVIFLADNGACAEDIPEGVTIDELVDKLMIAKANTRKGEPVHFGNDPYADAGPREHLPELRHGLGQPVEHAVPPLQALDPRRRHRDAADRALAARHQGEGRPAPRAGLPARHHGDDRRRDRRDLSQGVRRQRDPALEGESLVPAFARAYGGRGPMFWEHEGNAAVRIGKWKLVRNIPGRGSSTTWRPTAPSCTTSPRSIRSGWATWRRSTRPGRSAAA